MSKRNAIIRKLTAVETLGCTQIICSDKTGTLTQNKMTVVEHVADDEKLLETAMALCSDAELDRDSGEAVGEPTECALVNDAAKNGLPKPELEKEYERVGEAPFDSMRKMMSTVHRTPDNKIIQFTKGAPDEILKRCAYALRDGEKVPMTDQVREEILKNNKAMADRALRVLCASLREWDDVPQNTEPEYLEKDLTYVGLSGMIDPVRPEVKAAIEECREAGIRPIMITGDHKDTAVAIGMELGIISEPSQAITGAQLDDISDEEFKDRITEFSVYARVQPEHKVRIVKAWKARGMITAMTGDGVNDAPSIKSADIGIGMGITGTDVTKNVADMVLADDNFATIVSAVEEGRRIYANMRKAIQFLLASNLAEVLSIFFATMIGFTILQPVHLLWINLITDCFPALALGLEESEPDSMKRKPRDPKEGIFAGGMGFDVFFQGVIVTALVLFSYVLGHRMESGVWEFVNSPDGTTMAFLTLSMVEICHSLNMRSRRGSIFKLNSHNKFLYGAMLASLILTTAVIEVPFLASAFQFTPIDLEEYAVALGLAILIIPIMEVVKAIQRKPESNTGDKMRSRVRRVSFQRTINACFAGYVVQAVVNNFVPLLFVMFQDSYQIPLSKITLLITVNFVFQLVIDILSAGFIDKIGYKTSVIIAHFCAGGRSYFADSPSGDFRGSVRRDPCLRNDLRRGRRASGSPFKPDRGGLSNGKQRKGDEPSSFVLLLGTYGSGPSLHSVFQRFRNLKLEGPCTDMGADPCDQRDRVLYGADLLSPGGGGERSEPEGTVVKRRVLGDDPSYGLFRSQRTGGKPVGFYFRGAGAWREQDHRGSGRSHGLCLYDGTFPAVLRKIRRQDRSG